MSRQCRKGKGMEIGSVFGKKIHAIPSIKLNSSQIKRFFSKFNKNETLRLICSLSKNIMFGPHLEDDRNIIYTNKHLCDAVSLILKHCSGKEIPNKDDTKSILKIAIGDSDKTILSSKQNPEYIFMKISYEQFKDDSFHSIARTWALYKHIWPLAKTNIDPLQDIENIVGIPYIVILLYGLAAAISGGFFFEFDKEQIKDLSDIFKIPYKENSHKLFLNWISKDSEKWLKYSNPPHYISHPVFRTKLLLDGCNKDVYFVPSAYNVLNRVTTGIYHDLARKYRAKEKNLFKIDYGVVFEKYVGVLLQNHLECLISPEIEYQDKKEQKKSIDYFLMDNRQLILIEVKQSSIFAESKYAPSEDLLKNDLDKNVSKAVKQLNETEKIILSKTINDFNTFFNAEKIIKLVIFCDPLENANNICKGKLETTFNDLSNFEFINIEDLEMMLAYQKNRQNFFELMFEKNTSYTKYDFNEFLCKKMGNESIDKSFLKKYYDEVFPEQFKAF